MNSLIYDGTSQGTVWLMKCPLLVGIHLELFIEDSPLVASGSATSFKGLYLHVVDDAFSHIVVYILLNDTHGCYSLIFRCKGTIK